MLWQWARPPRRRASDSGRLQVRVAVELALVEALQRLALGQRHAAVADGALAVTGERRIQLGDVVLHVLQHLVGGVALDDLLDPPAALIVQAHMHDVRVAEEVVEVAEGFLVGPDQEGREVVLLTRLQLVQLEGALHVAQRDEVIDLAVRVAGDVSEHRGARRALPETVNWHDRKQLVDRPAVRQRLEYGEVAEVGVREDRFEVLELFRQPLELAAGIADLGARRPVEPFGEPAEFERQQPEVEHLQRLLARGERVVVALDQAALAHRAIGLEQIQHRLRQLLLAAIVLAAVAGDTKLVELRRAKRIEYQHAVIGRHGAPGFADDHGMRNVARVTDAGDAVHDVARVLVERVVHRGGEVRAAAVVVHTQSAADVDVLQARTHQLQLRVHVCELVDRLLDAADVLQLAARVAVHQLQAVEHVVRLQNVEQLQDLGDEQAELRLLARRGAPAPGTLAEELHTHAHARAYLIVAGVLEDEAELIEILHHRNDGAAELSGQRHRLDVAVILEAVADDEPLGCVLGHGHDCQQLRLRADFESEAELLAVAIHLLDHQSLLVHLDRVHRSVLVPVVVLGDGLREGVVQAPQAMRQYVREAHHNVCR